MARFAAYKAFHATQQLRRQLADREGVERSPEEFDRMARAVLNTFNRYQAAEYNTAVARARTAKQWADFSQGDNMFLFPNIRWLPSRSATPREQHMPFYNRVWAKTDPFWSSNQPGNLWNCKCDWEETDDPVTGDNPEGLKPARGLEGNPAETGQIFTDQCTYIQKAGKWGSEEVEKFLAEINKENEKQAGPDQEIEQTLGIKRGKPMTFDEANELRGNPHYEPGTGYAVNCQCAVVANELRRRGFDVQAMPNTRAKDSIPYMLSKQTQMAWIDPATGAMPNKTSCNKVDYVLKGWKVQRKGQTTREIAANIDEATKQPGRYHLDFSWKGKDEGHIVTVERLEDGKVRLYDPQTGQVKSWAKDYAPRISTIGEVNVLRVDGLMPNPEIVKGAVTKAGTAKSSAPLSTTRGGTKGEAKNSLPESVKSRRKEIKSEAKRLTSVTLHHPVFNKGVTINGNTIREWTNQPHCNYAEKNEMLLNIEEVFRKSEYLGYGPDKHSSNITAHFFKTKVGNVDSWIIVREYPDGNVILHDISDSPNITNWITNNP